VSKEGQAERKKTDLLQGTLDSMVLQTLEALGRFTDMESRDELGR